MTGGGVSPDGAGRGPGELGDSAGGVAGPGADDSGADDSGADDAVGDGPPYPPETDTARCPPPQPEASRPAPTASAQTALTALRMKVRSST
jgi:hypothetical protein